jgi:anti-anti-sigma factor
MSQEALFKSEDLGDVVVVSPTRDMGEFEMADCDAPAYDQLVKLTDGRNVVFDFSQTDYFGSSSIGIFIRLAKHVRGQDRVIAFCNLSEHEMQVIRITHINEILDFKDSRESAIEFVRGNTVQNKSTGA